MRLRELLLQENQNSDWAYHYTNSENLSSIAKEGLSPDKSRMTRKATYFMTKVKPEYHNYLKANPGMYGDSLLRTHVSNLPKDTIWKQHSTRMFHYTSIPSGIEPHKLEHLKDNKWIKL